MDISSNILDFLPRLDPVELGLTPPAPPARPVLELRETPDGYVMRTEIQDLEHSDLRVTVGSDFLEVEGHFRQLWSPPKLLGLCFGLDSGPLGSIGLAAARPVARELDFARRFGVSQVDVASARASFEDGVLEVWLPKRSAQQDGGAGQARQLLASKRAA